VGAGVAQGGGATTAKPRTRRGKVTNVGGHRVVNYYELTKNELDRLGEKRSEAAQSVAIGAFMLGVAVDLIKDFCFDPPEDATMLGIWATLLVVTLLGAIYFLAEGYKRGRKAKSFLKDIQDEHDF
jgi:hypothetical protein